MWVQKHPVHVLVHPCIAVVFIVIMHRHLDVDSLTVFYRSHYFRFSISEIFRNIILPLPDLLNVLKHQLLTCQSVSCHSIGLKSQRYIMSYSMSVNINRKRLLRGFLQASIIN